MHIRGAHIVILASLALLVSGVGGRALASGGPSSTGPVIGGGGGGGSSTGPSVGTTTTPTQTSTPPSSQGTTQPQYHPTPAATGLTAKVASAGTVLLAWKLHAGSSVQNVIVRRGRGSCPATTSQGVQVGGTAFRRTQKDPNAAIGVRSCYTVFTVGPYGTASTHTALVAGHAAAVTAVTATAVGKRVVIRWQLSPGAVEYKVRRAVGTCPATVPGKFIGRKGAQTSALSDRHPAPGTQYCYAVVAIDGTHHVSAATSARAPVKIASSVQPASKPAPTATPPAASSTSAFSSHLARIVAIVALAVLLLAAVAFVAVRLVGRERADDWQFSTGRGASKVALGDYSAGALVIPAVIVAVGLILLIAAVLSL